MIKVNFSRLLSVFMLLGVMFFASCSDDESNNPILPGEEGFFVLNEGLFGAGNASLSFFDKNTGAVQNDIFFAANGRPLGDQAQSMTIVGDRGYILIQNSNKIEVIDTEDFSSITTIDEQDGLTSPRYLIAINDEKAYVSDWGSNGVTGTVKVLDLNTNTITKTIPVGIGSNRMVLANGNVYVTNEGGFNNETFQLLSDNKVRIISTATDEVVSEITVGDNPKSIEVDNDGNIWVSGPGSIVFNPDFSIDEEATTAGFISKISPTNELLLTVVLDAKTVGPDNMVINNAGNTLYFNYLGQVFTLNTDQDVSGGTVDVNTFINKNFYGFSIDPSTGDFIGLEAPNFTSNGTMLRYTEGGSLIDDFEVGIGPNGATFK